MKRYIVMSIVFIIGLCCGVIITKYQISIVKSGRTMNQPDRPKYELQQDVWLRGDTDSYQRLSLAYIDSNPAKEGFFWPFYMANQYGYPQAYWDVYFFLEQTYMGSYLDSALYKMDSQTRSFAIRYLKIAAEKNESNAIRKLQEFKEKKYPTEWLVE